MAGPDPREYLEQLAEKRRAQHYVYVADAVSDLVLDRADVVYVFDVFGNKFLDLSAGDGVMTVGHHNPPVIDAVTEHMKHHQQTARSGEHASLRVTEYAKALSETFPQRNGVPQQVLFCPSPSEAMAEAMALARAISGVMSQSALELVDADMLPMDQRQATGFVERYERFRACVIVDERRTGFGRTGAMWAHEPYGIDPDITVLGGAGGGGFPFGAVVAPQDYFVRYRPAQRQFGASPVICAAGLAMIGQITAPLLEHVKDAGLAFTDAVTELRNQFPDIIAGSQGVGLAQAVICRDENIALLLFPELLRQGLLLRPPRGRILSVTPSLIISESEMRHAVDLMASACLDWAEPL